MGVYLMRDYTKVISLWQNKSFTAHFPAYITMAECDVFIQQKMYDVVIPTIQPRTNELNLFEKIILRFSELTIFDTERISELICVEKDLIRFIQNKLINLEYLENNNTITSKGNDYLSNTRNSKSEIKNVCGKVFINLTNKLSTYIQTNEDAFGQGISCDTQAMVAKIGSAGSECEIYGKVIKGKLENRVIKQRELIKNIFAYNKLCENNSIFHKLQLDKYHIDISRTSEEIFLHYKLVILKGNASSFLVSDGFSICDKSLGDYISDNYSQIINELKKKASSRQDIVENTTDNQTEYPEVSKLLTPPEKKAKTFDEQKDEYSNNNMKLADYYSAVEWSFYHHLKTKVINKALLDSFISGEFEENSERIAIMAKTIGIKKCNDYMKLFKFNSTNIKRFLEKNESPEMQTVVSLAILTAKYETESELHNLIRQNENFLRFISELKSLRDKQSHGGEETEKKTYDEIYKIYLQVCKIVNVILPGCTNENIQNKSKGDVSQNFINKEVFLIKELGPGLYQQFNSHTKELLHDIVDTSSNNQYRYILSLSKLLETLLKSVILELSTICTEKLTTKDEIVNKLIMETGDCPDTLSSVKEYNIKKALECKKATLGAYVLAMIALSELNKDELIIIVGTVDEILTLRGHGNNVNLLVNHKMIKHLRTEVLKTIKIIGGI